MYTDERQASLQTYGIHLQHILPRLGILGGDVDRIAHEAAVVENLHVHHTPSGPLVALARSEMLPTRPFGQSSRRR